MKPFLPSIHITWTCVRHTHDVIFIETIYERYTNAMPVWKEDLGIYELWHLQSVPLATSRQWYVLKSI